MCTWMHTCVCAYVREIFGCMIFPLQSRLTGKNSMKVVGCCLWGEGDSVVRSTWSEVAHLTNKFMFFIYYVFVIFVYNFMVFFRVGCTIDFRSFFYTHSVQGIVGVVQQHIYSNSKVCTIRDLQTLFDNIITLFLPQLLLFSILLSCYYH